MSGYALLQLLNGLSHACTLFLMAAGLTLIFGVTRIVNFAHGSFFMLGALFSAHWLTHWFPDWAQHPALYALALLLGAAVAGAVGAVAEVLVLRRMVGVPELYQLVATFGLTLFLHDLMRGLLGPDEVFAPRFPGLKGAIALGDAAMPVWQLVLLVLGPLVWALLHVLLHHTRFGRLLQAAAHDRDMLAALGVNPRPLMLGAVVLGCALAGLGGALQLPREPAHLQMDVQVVVETFVVVVTGGLGSIGGAFAAAVLIGVVHALGVSFLPQATLVLVFLPMAAVLLLRPQGLAGRWVPPAQHEKAEKFAIPTVQWRFVAIGFIAISVVLVLGAAWVAPAYALSLWTDAVLLMLLGLSLQFMMGLGGLVSFGHAAFLAVGAYGAALAHRHWGLALPGAVGVGALAALALAALWGAVLMRSAGVYLAMLSLALAQVIWALATQWVSVTGGDNGVIGLQLLAEDQRGVFAVGLTGLAAAGLWGLARLSQSSFGMALQAARDVPARAAASGWSPAGLRYQAFVLSATLAGLTGGLATAHHGAVFPSVASVAMSVDALLVVLLGGVHQLWGTVVGALLLTGASAGLGQGFEYWRGALGVMVMVVMVAAPSGLLGVWTGARQGRSGGAHGA